MIGLSRCGRAVAVGVALASSVILPATVRASDPVSVYVSVQGIERRPSAAAPTEVVIHGAFIMLGPGGAGYGAAQCGYMYFRCRPGDEAMCALQWQDVERIGTAASTCAGFGQLNTASTARVRAAGTTPADPDLWDLGIGVGTGMSVGSQCPAAKTLDCSRLVAPDAGAPAGSGGKPAPAGTGGAAGSGVPSGSGGASGTGTGGATSDGTGGAASGGTGGQQGQGGKPGTLPGDRSSCAVATSVAGAATPGAAGVAAAGLAAAAFLRARRRRGGGRRR
jgi:hypothetical protein